MGTVHGESEESLRRVGDGRKGEIGALTQHRGAYRIGRSFSSSFGYLSSSLVFLCISGGCQLKQKYHAGQICVKLCAAQILVLIINLCREQFEPLSDERHAVVLDGGHEAQACTSEFNRSSTGTSFM